MSEYGIYSSQDRGHSGTQYASQPASNVEWYSSSSQQQQQYSNYNYHEQSFPASSGAQYGTFEDEAPLLEGAALVTFMIPYTEINCILFFSQPCLSTAAFIFLSQPPLLLSFSMQS
jgi:hypothetical protein